MVGSDVSEHVIQFKHVLGQILLQFAAKWEKKRKEMSLKNFKYALSTCRCSRAKYFGTTLDNANYVYLRRRRDIDEEI